MHPNQRQFMASIARAAALLLILVSVLAVPIPAVAQEGAPVVLTARAGFDGYYRDGRWLPVRVTLTNNGPSVDGQLRVAVPRYDGTETTFARDVSLPTQSHKEFFVYVIPEGYLAQLKVELYSGRTRIASAATRVSQIGNTDLIYGVVAGSPSAFNALAEVDPAAGSAVVAQLGWDDLPDHAPALKSLDVLVFSDVDTGQLSEAQRTALSGWVSGGGRLVVAGGPGWQKTAVGLEELLPIQVSGTQTLPAFAALSQFAGSVDPLAGTSPVAVGTLLPDATVRVSQDNVPLVVSRAMGYGETTFLAVDPAVAPFNTWADTAMLYRNLFSIQQERPSWAEGFSEWYQASEAIYTIPGLNLPSALQLCGFLLLYIVAVGPVNYVLLKRLKRREWAWVTIPAVVLLFSGMAYLLGYKIRGNEPVLHRLAVVQVWPDSEAAQVDGLVGVFSPRRDEYDVEFASDFLVRSLPPNYSAIDPGNFPGPIEQGGGTRISDLRVEVGGLSAFVAQGQVEAPRFETDLRLDISASSARLVGTITNASAITLRGAVLLGPGAVQRLDDIPAGDSRTIDLPLAATRATPAQPNAAAAVYPAAVPPISTGAGRPVYGSYDSTVDDILGATGYYEDKETYRKYSLLRAVVNPYGGAGGRGSGIFLAGWADGSPIGVELVNDQFSTQDSTAYLIALKPRVELGAAELELTPGLFNWSVVDPGVQGSPSPYDMYVYQGHYVLRFAPIQALSFQSVEALTLHLSSYGAAGRANLGVSLWDYTRSDWAPIADVAWGDTAIPEPGRFVGPGGEIRLKIENPSGNQTVNIEASDFTLKLRR